MAGLGLLSVGGIVNAQSRLATPSGVDVSAREAVAPDPLPVSAARPAPAPAHGKPWTFEFRGGLGLSTNPTEGAGQLPGLGNVILPATPGIGPARTVSSWFFGDGTAQLNSLAATRALPQLPALDAILTSLGATRDAGGTFGFTIGRDLSAHWAIDFDVDANLQAWQMTSAATSAIESTRAGFVNTFQALFQTSRSASSFTGLAVTATATGATSGGSQVAASGSLKYRLRPRAKLDPFISIGAGLLADAGSIPSQTLTGDYQFTFATSAGPIPYKQTDTVTIHALDGGSRLVGILGFGVDKTLSAHSGLRFAVRLTVASNRAETTLDASPTTQTSSPQLGLFFESSPTTIIINNGSLPSTLSGPPVAGFGTFVGRGIKIESAITAGYFFRF